MAKNLLVISTSPRKGGNSETLAKEFAKVAVKDGKNVEFINLREKNIGFCKGCLACQKTGKCVIKDDAAEVLEKMKNADEIAFATPIYFYEMCGQMKTLLDRTNAIFLSKYKFRKIYLLATAADDAQDTIDGAKKGLEGWIRCFDKSSLADTIFVGGVTEIGDIKGVKIEF